ncbi:unnamed protein product [Linum tenue]|uniref:Uncharacterized protein n=1 Tax=Linum tenue TaxID=586396 RepID=A0AAV0LQ33_9ROSI|nr:unnamed protein product [Linum tenue]
MVTGTVPLKWSTGNLSRTTSTFPPTMTWTSSYVEVEEREKVDICGMCMCRARTGGCLVFWEEAFEAAYEALVSDAAAVRDGAISEIAKMSILSINLESFSAAQSSNQPL